MPLDFAGNGLALDQAGMDATAAHLGVGAAEIWTVLNVETRGCGFLPDRRPAILFERHIFHRRTQGKYDKARPDISNARPGGYRGGAAEYDRLAAAIAFDRKAALESASWGIGQIMGFNAVAAGFTDAAAMVAASMVSESNQLQAMAKFLSSNSLAAPLKAHDWAAFASGYNGPAYAKNGYDVNLAGAYAKFAAGPLPNLSVRAAQLYLTYLDYSPGPIDGWIGRLTRTALADFQQDNGLPTSGDADAATLAALAAKVG